MSLASERPIILLPIAIPLVKITFTIVLGLSCSA